VVSSRRRVATARHRSPLTAMDGHRSRLITSAAVDVPARRRHPVPPAPQSIQP